VSCFSWQRLRRWLRDRKLTLLLRTTFLSSPQLKGTGKTTVARAIAEVLFRLELKPSDKIVERSANDLTADYVGQTSSKVTEALQDAKGGVLFIDEAYTLGDGPFGKEACDTLVAAMTSDNFRDVQLVIAGYPREMDEMFRTNPGFRSRFTHFFDFPDWTPADCVGFFKVCAEKEKFVSVGANVEDALRIGCEELLQYDGWANGRDVKRIFEETKAHRSDRVYDQTETEKILLLPDLEKALESTIASRTPKDGIGPSTLASRWGANGSPPPGQTTFSRPPNRARFELKQVCDAREKVEYDAELDTAETCTEQLEEATQIVEANMTNFIEEEGENEDSICCSPVRGSDGGDGRDEGVPDEVWDELQASKARDLEQLERLERLKEEQAELARHEEEARIRHEEDLKRIEKERVLAEQARLRKLAEEADARRRHEADVRRKRLEDEARRLEDERKRQEQIRERLRQISPCPMGFNWNRTGDGWRCGGGSHYVSDEQLHRQFGYDV